MSEIIKGTESKEPSVELQALDELKDHPDPKVREAYATLVTVSTRRRAILMLVQEALQQLRLDMKYLIFDLEATRRERDEYKDQLGEK